MNITPSHHFNFSELFWESFQATWKQTQEQTWQAVRRNKGKICNHNSPANMEATHLTPTQIHTHTTHTQGGYHKLWILTTLYMFPRPEALVTHNSVFREDTEHELCLQLCCAGSKTRKFPPNTLIFGFIAGWLNFHVAVTSLPPTKFHKPNLPSPLPFPPPLSLSLYPPLS